MTENYTITVTNKKIAMFYKEHSNLNFETMNILFVDILGNLMQSIDTSTVNGTIASQLLSSMQEVKDKMCEVSKEVKSAQSTTEKDVALKISELKNEHMKQFKLILSANTADVIHPLIQKHTESIVDKTQLIISSIIPANENVSSKVEQIMNSFRTSIITDTKTLCTSENISQSSLTDLSNSINTRLSDAIASLNSTINSTERRIDSKLETIHSASTISNSGQSELKTSVGELLKKMENSSAKGKISENVLCGIMLSLYPSAEVDFVGTQKETGDIIMERLGRPKILIENKNYGRNVSQEEVKKFIRDVETQDCCGLFLSQNFGIANKDNFEINTHNGNVLVYVHDVNNDPEKIKIAIEIIDHFKSKLDDIREMSNDTSEIYHIQKDTLDEINREYQSFVVQKLTHIRTIKEMSQKMLRQTDEMKFPTLENYLLARYAFSSSKFVCEYCDYIGKNQGAISAHQRNCKKKKEKDRENEQQKTVTLV